MGAVRCLCGTSAFSHDPRRRRFLAAARGRRIPIVYVNDNFRRWRDSLPEIIRRTTRAGLAGSEVVAALAPGPTDYFILKPRHSGFPGTPLEFLLDALRVRTDARPRTTPQLRNLQV